MYGNRFGPSAPVKEGEEIDVKIEAIGDKGDGIAKKDGFVLVVPGTQLNDEVRVRITKVLRKVGFAEVIGEAETKDEPEEEEEEKLSTEEVVENAEEIEDTEDFGEDIDEEKE